MKFRVEEDRLQKEGFGYYRCFTIDRNGNMLIAGHVKPDKITLFTLSEKGEIKSTRIIEGFPVLSSIAVDKNDNLYFFCPGCEKPVYVFQSGENEPVAIGDFPGDNDKIYRKMGRIALDKKANLYIIFETEPAYLFKYDPEGQLVFKKEFPVKDKSVDLMTRILDLSVNPESGNLFLLENALWKDKKLVKVLDPDGNQIDSFFLHPVIRRICVAENNLIYSSGTLFGVHCMLLSMGIYGAVTILDVNKIENGR